MAYYMSLQIGFAKINNWYQVKPLLEEFAQNQIKSVQLSKKKFLKIININSYSKFDSKSNISNLDYILKLKYGEQFYTVFLQEICEIALNVKEVLGDSLEKTLKQNSYNKTIQLTRQQCYCIVSLMFLNLLEQKNFKCSQKISCTYLMQQIHSVRNDCNTHKLKCILEYLNLMVLNKDNKLFMQEKIQITRHSSQKSFNKNNELQQLKMCKVEIQQKGQIQDNYFDSAIINFANKTPGGGVLGNGAVQEEILFATCPEMLVSLIYCEELNDNETLQFQNINQYVEHQGYSDTFRFQKLNKDQKILEIISIDSLNFKEIDPKNQYKKHLIDREIQKAYIGFSNSKSTQIATGNWGCGAFKGDHQLKFLIQWVAASISNKNLIYCTFQEKPLYLIQEIYQKLQKFSVQEILENILYDINIKKGQIFNQILEQLSYMEKIDKKQMEDIDKNKKDNNDLQQFLTDSTQIKDQEILLKEIEQRKKEEELSQNYIKNLQKQDQYFLDKQEKIEEDLSLRYQKNSQEQNNIKQDIKKQQITKINEQNSQNNKKIPQDILEEETPGNEDIDYSLELQQQISMYQYYNDLHKQKQKQK